MRRAGRIILYPNKAQRRQLYRHMEVCRLVWNWSLDYHEKFYKENGHAPKSGEIRAAVFAEKEIEGSDLECVKEISTLAAGNVPNLLTQAFSKFFSRKAGYPRKKYLNSDVRSFYVRPDAKINDGKITIPRCGKVKARQISGPNIDETHIYSPMCKVNGDKFELTFSYEVEEKEKSNNRANVLGVDVGVKQLAVLSNGKKYENPIFSEKIKALHRRLYKLEAVKRNKSKHKVEKIKSNSQRKIEAKIKKIHHKIKCYSDNAIHTVSKDIVYNQGADIVVTENLLVRKLIDDNNKRPETKRLAGYIKDTKLSKLLLFINYKCEDKGVPNIKTPPGFNSSSFCSSCGSELKGITLDVREIKCEHCGDIIDRDINAAINLANYL